MAFLLEARHLYWWWQNRALWAILDYDYTCSRNRNCGLHKLSNWSSYSSYRALGRKVAYEHQSYNLQPLKGGKSRFRSFLLLHSEPTPPASDHPLHFSDKWNYFPVAFRNIWLFLHSLCGYNSPQCGSTGLAAVGFPHWISYRQFLCYYVRVVASYAPVS